MSHSLVNRLDKMNHGICRDRFLTAQRLQYELCYAKIITRRPSIDVHSVPLLLCLECVKHNVIRRGGITLEDIATLKE